LKIKQIQRDEQKDENISILRKIIKTKSVVYTLMINSSKQIELNLNQNMMKRNSIIDSYKNDEITLKDACKMLQKHEI